LKCVLFEREIFPRLHVGESLVPASNRGLRDIGVIDQMDEAGFVRKYGAVWTSSPNGPVYYHDLEGLGPDYYANIRFEERQQPGVDCIYTWHVDRGKFDLMLLQQACKLGAAVYGGCRVSSVDFSDPSTPRIKFPLGKQEGGVRVRLVVDASGRHTLLGNQMKFKNNDPVFNQYALHTWYEGYDRSGMALRDSNKDYIFIHFLPVSNTWLWQIPISDTVTSIGVVTQRKNFEKSRASREKFFWDCISTRPDLYAGLQAAKQLRPLREEGDYSYGMSQICGDGFVMVGDAARFVDPIFSSGVSIALTSAKLASQDILKAAEKGDFSKQSFETFQTTMRRGTHNWYEFISLYYRLNVLFTAFVQDRRYRVQVLKLLQGDMYDEEKPAVLAEMRKIVTQVEQRPNHPWHMLLGNLTSESVRAAY
jgi:FADH2 O2-dependent halogenase